MKNLFVITLVSFLSISAFAVTQVLSDIGYIGSSSEVQKFFEQNKLDVESITCSPQGFCNDEPSSYVVKAKNQSGKTCEVWVMAGYCADGNAPSNHSKVTVLTEASAMKCQ
jgi:hypothetical protein